ncbi:hypothetical protein FQN54_001124 [Arachnomyces sp. PD_36]|nr:hypothetical protein FQN54_001124 [Arachnomyces sp. PD_36]
MSATDDQNECDSIEKDSAPPPLEKCCILVNYGPHVSLCRIADVLEAPEAAIERGDVIVEDLDFAMWLGLVHDDLGFRPCLHQLYYDLDEERHIQITKDRHWRAAIQEMHVVKKCACFVFSMFPRVEVSEGEES